MKNFLNPKVLNLWTFIWVSVILFFSYQMFQIIWPYTSWAWDVDFLQTKQHIIHLDYYRLAFYLHIFSSLFVLVGGAFLFSKKVLCTYPVIHRQIGKMYVFLLLLISAPTGMVMACYANGGFTAQLSFLILSPLWWWFTWKGFQTAKNKQFHAHKNWMMRSYALTLSAITLRLAQMIINTFCVIDPQVLYVAVSWGSWIGNLMVVEMLIFRNQYKVQRKILFAG